MKAVLFYAPGDIRFEEIPRPMAGPGEVVLQVKAALTCGTEVGCQNSFYDGAAANNHDDSYACTLVDTWSIGDRIWNDLNSNGADDAEPILGVTALESVGIEVDPRTQRLNRLCAARLK